MTTVAVYSRLSQDRDGTQTATDRQEQACRQFAASRGWTVTETHSDVDISAYRKGVVRPGFEKLVVAVSTGHVGGVLCWKLDRLVRSHADFERLWTACEKSGAILASATEPVDSSSEIGMIVVRLLVSFARLESANISLRVRAVNERKARDGVGHVSGQRAFGLARDYTDVEPLEAAEIRDAVARILTGTPVGVIAKDWNARGITTTTGKQWRPAILRRTLMSPHLAALRVHHGEIVGEGRWPAILDRQTHDEIKAVLTHPSRSTGGGGPARYPLSGGPLRCGLCESKMVSRPRSDGVRRYVCSTEPGRQSCGRVGILAEPLEHLVRDAISARLSPDRLQRARADLHGADEVRRVLLARLDADARALEDAARDRYEHRTITAAQFAVVNRTLQQRIEESQRRLERLTAPTLAHLPPDIKQAWDDADDAWRRQLVAAMIDRITVGPARRGLGRFDPDRVSLTWAV